jgi:hypothetical protein
MGLGRTKMKFSKERTVLAAVEFIKIDHNELTLRIQITASELVESHVPYAFT